MRTITYSQAIYETMREEMARDPNVILIGEDVGTFGGVWGVSGDLVKLFGEDYDTPDGTCIRDYVHVNDLCQAHLLALERLLQGGGSAAYNLGNGSGFSVREVIAAAEHVTGIKIPVVVAPRRAGDPARLVADASLAQRELGWRPQYSELEQIIRHAWQWEQKLAQRFSS